MLGMKFGLKIKISEDKKCIRAIKFIFACNNRWNTFKTPSEYFLVYLMKKKKTRKRRHLSKFGHSF